MTPVSRLLYCAAEAAVAHTDSELDDDAITLPPPGDESQEEHDRIRRSNDIDQEKEREGAASKHNSGYDQAVKGAQ
jgi:hypothetical protein